MRLFVFAVLTLTSVAAAAQSGGASNYAVTADGDTLRTNVEFKSPLLGKSHVMVEGERREIEDFSVLYLDGTTNAVVDGRRLAPLLTDGRLRFYARTVSTAGMMVPTGPNGQMAFTGGRSSEVGYIQVPGGPVERATLGNLRGAMTDNPESMGHLNRAQITRTVGWALTAAGAAAFAVGAYNMIQAEEAGEDITQYAPFAIGGAITLSAVQFVFPGLERSARNQAIDSYNSSGTDG